LTAASHDPPKPSSATPANKAAPKPATAVKAKIAPKANASSPKSCLKTAGLGHIRSLGRTRWQGTTGENSTRDINASVFVTGPYPSTSAANRAAQRARFAEIAFPGGRYLVTASKPSYLSATVSLAAACLSAGSGKSYSF
jgi:hypothetical protein